MVSQRSSNTSGMGTVLQCGCEGGDTGGDDVDGVGECEAVSMLL